MRSCNKCGVVKNISEYRFDKGFGKYGKICKKCIIANTNRWKKMNKDRLKMNMKKLLKEEKEFVVGIHSLTMLIGGY